MDAGDLWALDLGLLLPWRLAGPRVDTSKTPPEVFLEVSVNRGAEHPCPLCGVPGKAHDLQELNWRHLNLFQHHCCVTARLPRVDCPGHGVKSTQAPWAREGSLFNLLFEQAVLKGIRWLLLKIPENLWPDKGEPDRLRKALEINQPLACAYYMKEGLRRLWDQPNKQAAEFFLIGWMLRAWSSGLAMLRKFAGTSWKMSTGGYEFGG